MKLDIRDLLFFICSIVIFLTIIIIDFAISIPMQSFTKLILLNIFLVVLYQISIRKITFELLFNVFIVLFIFSRAISGIIYGDDALYTTINTYGYIEVDEEITKFIFSIYCAIIHISFLIGLIFKGNYYLPYKNNTFSRKIFNHQINSVNNKLLLLLFIFFIPIQISYINFIFTTGYLSIFNSDGFAGLIYKDLISRAIYLSLPIAFIFQIKTFQSISKSLIFLIGLFIFLEILTGQRGHAVLFGMSLYLFHSIALNKNIGLVKLSIYTFVSIALLVSIDILRSSESSQSFLLIALQGFGTTLNTHQVGIYFEENLRDMQNSFYSLYGITDYIERLLNPGLENIYNTRSHDLLLTSDYLGHKLTYLMNKDTWLFGYGLGSAFVLELYIDFGIYISLFFMIMLLILYKFYESRIRFANGYLLSLIFINFTQYLLFLPRGSLSNFFPTLIFIIFFYSFIIATAYLLFNIKKILNQHQVT